MDGSGNIEVTAPKNITLNAGEDITMSAGMNIISTAGENINTSAGMNISESAGGNIIMYANVNFYQKAASDYSLMAANITQFAKKDFMSQSEILTKTSGKIQAMALKGDITFNAKNTVKDNSGENSLSH